MTEDQGKTDKKDRLSEAVRRAEQAVIRHGEPSDKDQGADLQVQPGTSLPPMAPAGQAKAPGGQEAKSITLDHATNQLPDQDPFAELAPPAGPSPGNLGYGEVDLGDGGGDPSPPLSATLPRSPARAQPSLPSPREPRQTPAPPLPPRPATPVHSDPQMRPASKVHREGPVLPKRSHAREFKIALLVLALLAIVAAAVFGILTWRQSVEQQRQAELDQLNRHSRDALMDDAVQKEKYRP